MRRIQKEISLEKFISRLPSIIPSFKENKLYYFDEDSLKLRNNMFTSNYGMVPLNVTISGFTNNNYGFAIDENQFSDDRNIRTFSFYSLSNLYHFFDEYYLLLRKRGHCHQVYTSAVEYYDTESKLPNASLVYGLDRENYVNLDNHFKEMGGKIGYTSSNVDGEDLIIDVYDIGFYKFISENLIPTFTIPNEYKDYWKRDALFYPDVIKWIGWFLERNHYKDDAEYDETLNKWNCNNENVDNCCECEEYFKRGGDKILQLMLDWYTNIQINIKTLNNIVRENLEVFIPHMIQTISMTASLKSTGEMTILSEEYILGTNYKVNDTVNGTVNSQSGTTVVKDGQSLILTSTSGDGFCYDSYYMEKIFKDDDWKSYTKYFKQNNPSKFKEDFKYYAFDKNNKIITSNISIIDLENKFYNYYDLIEEDAVIINGDEYFIEKAESGIGDDGNTYLIYRDNVTQTPYIMLNGNKVFAKFYPYAIEPYYYFTIFKENTYNRKKALKDGDRVDNINQSFKENNYKKFPRIPKEEDMLSYINYEGTLMLVTDSGLTIDETDYYRVKGYAYDDKGVKYFYRYDNKIVYYDYELAVEVENASVENNMLKMQFDYTPIVYNAKEITGTTISKLNDLALNNYLIDDIGNQINGIYDIEKKYNHQPQEGEELELIYQVGNTYFNDKSVFNKTILNPNTSEETNYFVGNIITEMSFYYKDANGITIEETRVTVRLNDDGTVTTYPSGEISSATSTVNYTSLAAIKKAAEKKDEFDIMLHDPTEDENKELYLFDDDIYCDITYNNGATLIRKKEQQFALADKSKYHYGVEYKESVKFVKRTTEYYLKSPKTNYLPIYKNKVDNHSISYPIYVYELSQDLTSITSDSYQTAYNAPLAKFKTIIDLGSKYYEDNYEDISNNLEIYPLFAEEYRLNSSSMQNVNVDIYIDRGVNSAFENHLKLGEVTSLEALEQYGNSQFKMMNS
jgi:hypothetical protein